MRTFLIFLAALLPATINDNHHLTVHEWGTFTTIAGKDGAALEWRPLAGTSDLPSFVYETGTNGWRHGHCVKCDLTGKIRMETPVLYFYADQPMEVSVRVDFPEGQITEWYPSARQVIGSIDWGRFAVLPNTNANLPVAESSRYYAARETDAALVRVCNTLGRPTEFEKFLFYRGVGRFDLPVSVKLEGPVLHLAGLTGIAQVIVFENRAGKIGYRIADVNAAAVDVFRPALGDSMTPLLASLEQMLVSQGLYVKEARAMLETWRDSWFEEGLRVFYILPRAQTDALLPLTVEPRPENVVRVLVGRVELITPELEARVLADPQSHSRFAGAVLKQLRGDVN